jgi:hypothetical protein
MTLEHQKISLRMGLHQGDTTQSSTHGVVLTKSDSETSQDTLASRILIDQITPHFPRDNIEVNMNVKHLQAMLDVATIANPVHDQEDEDRAH